MNLEKFELYCHCCKENVPHSFVCVSQPRHDLLCYHCFDQLGHPDECDWADIYRHRKSLRTYETLFRLNHPRERSTCCLCQKDISRGTYYYCGEHGYFCHDCYIAMGAPAIDEFDTIKRIQHCLPAYIDMFVRHGTLPK